VTEDELAARLRATGHRVTIDLRTDNDGAAAVIGIAPGTLKNWRLGKGRGPNWSELNGRAWYRLREIMDWISANSHPRGREMTGSDAA
jgi:hypothetical protein